MHVLTFILFFIFYFFAFPNVFEVQSLGQIYPDPCVEDGKINANLPCMH